jgi:hypothetical protein
MKFLLVTVATCALITGLQALLNLVSWLTTVLPQQLDGDSHDCSWCWPCWLRSGQQVSAGN